MKEQTPTKEAKQKEHTTVAERLFIFDKKGKLVCERPR